jgi:hypothetical protein
MELIVDVVKGSGTTIDGNTARRFFENLELTAEITGLNKNEILYILLLQAVVSLQAAMYGWYNMYRLLYQHVLLNHGADIIENPVLPIEQLSEEAQEARNKDILGKVLRCVLSFLICYLCL